MINFLYVLEVLQYFFISCVHEYMWFTIIGMLRQVWCVLLQHQSAFDTMPKKGKKKAKVVEEESDLEFMPRVEIIYEDTKSITRVELEFKWGRYIIFSRIIRFQTWALNIYTCLETY